MAKKIFDGLIYSQVWEDAELAAGALEIGPDDTVLTVTSAGDIALALTLAAPRRIVAIDINPVQNHWFEMKRAAIAELPYGELLELAGVRASRRRWALYGRVRKQLPAETRRVWDGQREVIERGWIFAGKFERYLLLFARALLPLVHTRQEITGLLSQPDVPAQRRYYREVWDNRRWRALFRIFFGRLPQRLIGRTRSIFTYAPDIDIGAIYLERAKRGLTEVPAGDNYYLEFLATGRYSGEHGLPHYLRQENQAALRRLAPRIEVALADMRGYLAQAPSASFSCFYLSDVFDYLSPEETEALFAELVRVARPGARLCYYRNLVSRAHPRSVDGRLEVLAGKSAELFAKSRACFYGGFVVERVLP